MRFFLIVIVTSVTSPLTTAFWGSIQIGIFQIFQLRLFTENHHIQLVKCFLSLSGIIEIHLEVQFFAFQRSSASGHVDFDFDIDFHSNHVH